jgi:pimeloyl-ACP methyl ester carboxylesterase
MPYAVNQGVRIHYQIEGDGEPLVPQHGFADSLETWYDLGYVDGLKPRYRLILIDARGHGASDKPHEPDTYDRERNVADITTVLDDLDVPRAHYFGHSMGGRDGFAIARYAPDRVHSLILGGGSPYPLVADPTKIRKSGVMPLSHRRTSGFSRNPGETMRSGSTSSRFSSYRIGSVPHRLRSRPPSAIEMTTRISSGLGASATETVIVSKCGNDQESSL